MDGLVEGVRGGMRISGGGFPSTPRFGDIKFRDRHGASPSALKARDGIMGYGSSNALL